MEHRRREKSLSPTILFLLIQLYQQLEKLPIKPPITIGLLTINILAYLHPYTNIFGYYLNDIQSNCLNPYAVVSNLTEGRLMINRLVLSSIMHADDNHLYYNMLSLCWKGINLERNMGSEMFAQLVIISLVLSHVYVVVLSYLLHTFTTIDSSYYSCAVGFSAVLFALKYVLNVNSPTYSYIMGFTVPARHLAWFELLSISYMNPRASFMGHLCGILAGVTYVHLPRVISVLLRPYLRYTHTPSSSSNYTSGTSYTYDYGRADRSSTSRPTTGSSTSPTSSNSGLGGSRPSAFSSPSPSPSSSSAYQNAHDSSNSRYNPTAPYQPSTSASSSSSSSSHIRHQRSQFYGS